MHIDNQPLTPKSRNGNVTMKTYRIDYTKISSAEGILYRATRLLANDCMEAQERIQEARRLLQEFLAGDNLVEDKDLADGLVRRSDVPTREGLKEMCSVCNFEGVCPVDPLKCWFK